VSSGRFRSNDKSLNATVDDDAAGSRSTLPRGRPAGRKENALESNASREPHRPFGMAKSAAIGTAMEATGAFLSVMANVMQTVPVPYVQSVVLLAESILQTSQVSMENPRMSTDSPDRDLASPEQQSGLPAACEGYSRSRSRRRGVSRSVLRDEGKPGKFDFVCHFHVSCVPY
jgi:hypothetical protein